MNPIKFISTILLLSNLLQQVAAQPCREIVGYYPNWQWYDRNKLVNPSTIRYHKYTVINYCFFKPEINGTISNTDTWADENLLKGQINWSTNPVSYYPNTSIIDLAHNAGTKVFVSIGGWTLSNNFPVIAASPSLRAKFASECNRLIKFYNFDGIDIDWEYPGYVPHGGTSADKTNFTLLLQEIRDSLNYLGTLNNKTYKLTACFAADQTKMQNIQWNNVVPLVDMINVMSYDFFGAWDCEANHNSPLYSTLSGNPNFNLNDVFLELKNTHNVPPNKINLGVAFYGRSQMGATFLYQPTNCTENQVVFPEDLGSPLYYNIDKNLHLFNRYWDNNAQVPYLLGKTNSTASGTFVSFDDKSSIGLKANYIKSNNLLGAIIWEISGDYIESFPGSGIISGTPLLDTLNQVFCNSTTGFNEDHSEKLQLVIAPNPSDGNFNITSNQEINQIEIYDGLGKMLSSTIYKSYNEINLKISSKGLFYIKIMFAENYIFKKVIVD